MSICHLSCWPPNGAWQLHVDPHLQAYYDNITDAVLAAPLAAPLAAQTSVSTTSSKPQGGDHKRSLSSATTVDAKRNKVMGSSVDNAIDLDLDLDLSESDSDLFASSDDLTTARSIVSKVSCSAHLSPGALQSM